MNVKQRGSRSRWLETGMVIGAAPGLAAITATGKTLHLLGSIRATVP
jgi:hypothetical protein